jgi:rare lipoprotein A
MLGMAGTVAAALIVLLPRPQASGASDMARLRSRIANDRSGIAAAAAQLAADRQRLAGDETERTAMLGEVSRRVVSIYRAGDVDTASAIATGATSPAVAADRADVLSTVEQQDNATMQRFGALTREIPALQRKVASETKQLAAARARLGRDQASLAKAQAAAAAAAAAAKKKAEELARVRQLPLTPLAVSPESVAAATAGEDTAAQAASGGDGSTSSDGSSSGSSQASAAPATTARSEDPAPAPAPAPPPQPIGFTQTGTASMYSDSFAGQPTASGEPYDPNALTAAHPTLPLGTFVSVKGPAGTVIVRINDRGPFVGGRILDLSRAAANAIGLGGLGQVTITVQH